MIRLVAFAAAALGAALFFALVGTHRKPAAISALFPPALAQALQTWISPSATPYNFTGASPSGAVVASGNVGSTLTIDLPAPSAVGANWAMAATTRNGQAIILTPPGGVSIVGGGRSLASLTLPATTGQNFEWAVLISDGTNFQVASVSAWTASWNGFQSYIPTRFETPGGPGYAATQVDNGYVIRPPAGGLTVTLPTSGLALGWTIGIEEASTAQPISLATSGQIETPGNNFASTYSPPLGRLMIVEWDGSYFHVLNAADPATSLHYASNAVLAGLTTIAGEVVERCGFYASGDSPCVHYEATATSCAAPDGGSQVPSASGCLLLQPTTGGEVDARDFGASGSATVAACSTRAGSPDVTLDQAWDFEIGQTIDCIGGGAAAGVGAPPAPSVYPIGPSGSSTACFKLAYIGINMQIGPASAETCIFTANSLLIPGYIIQSTSQGVGSSWSVPGSAVKAVVVYYSTSSGSETFLGVADPAAGEFNFYGAGSYYDPINQDTVDYDTGQTTLEPLWIPAAPLAGAGQAQMLQGQIVSGAGTTLVLNANAGSNASGQPAFHSDTAAIAAALAYQSPAGGGNHVVLGPGVYYVDAGLTSENTWLSGCGYGCSTLAPEGAGWVLWSAPYNNNGGTCSVCLGSGQIISDLSVNGLGQQADEVFYLDNSFATVRHVVVSDQFDLAYIGGTAHMINQPLMQDVQAIQKGSRGDYDIIIDGTENGGNPEVVKPTINLVRIGTCFQCAGPAFRLTGSINSTRSIDLTIDEAPGTLFQVDNDSNMASGPGLNWFTQTLMGPCWSICIDIKSPAQLPMESNTVHNTRFVDSFIQSVIGGGTSAVLIEPNSKRTQIWAANMSGVNTDQTGGADLSAIDDYGNSTVIGNVEVVGTRQAAVTCESGASTQITGGTDYNFKSGALPTSKYGVVLAPGCFGADVNTSQYIGLQGDVVDQTGTPNSNRIAGRPLGSQDIEILLDNNFTLNQASLVSPDCTTAPSIPSPACWDVLYGTPGLAVAYMQVGSAGGTVHFDTAANIIAGMNGQTQKSIDIENESRSTGSTAPIVLYPAAGDINLTIASQPSGGLAGGEAELCVLTKTPTSTIVVNCSL